MSLSLSTGVKRLRKAKKSVPRPNAMAKSARLSHILDLEAFGPAVRRKLPNAVYGYVANGSETETALATNRAAFDRWRLVPRVLVGVPERDQEIELFGRYYSAPFGIAPMGGSALVAFDGHNAMARAAAKARIPFVLSANSIVPMEEVAAQYPGAWFAAYQSPNRAAIEGMVARVARAGIGVLVITADLAAGSNREKDKKAGFSFPIRPGPRLMWDVARHPRWAAGVLGRTFLKRGYPHIVDLEPDGGPGLLSPEAGSIGSHDRLSWEHIQMIRSLWKGPLVIKGILAADDVLLARKHGVDGVIISNHGGRQLDHAISPIQALPAVMDAAKDLPVMIDGGFRRGTDIIKALALGSKAVFIGRPFLYAAALAGERGTAHGISLLSKEIDTDMALLGLRKIGDASRAHIADIRD